MNQLDHRMRIAGGYKAGSFTYVGNVASVAWPDNSIGTSPGPRWLAQ